MMVIFVVMMEHVFVHIMSVIHIIIVGMDQMKLTVVSNYVMFTYVDEYCMLILVQSCTLYTYVTKFAETKHIGTFFEIYILYLHVLDSEPLICSNIKFLL